MLDIFKNLPDKPSELIRLAITDLEACENDPQYKINMEVYHHPHKHKFYDICSVCLAGAVMAKTLKCNPKRQKSPAQYSKSSLTRKLDALNYFRIGELNSALTELTGKHEFDFNYVEVIPYDKNPSEFKSQLLKIAQDFEDKGM